MHIKLLKAKLHLATVTLNRPDYHGSITIDPDLMGQVGLLPYEAVTVSNTANGQRAETYVIPGEPGRGQIELNGAMARLALPGDRVIVMAFAMLEAHEVAGHQPEVVALDQANCVVERLEYPALTDPAVQAEPQSLPITPALKERAACRASS